MKRVLAFVAGELREAAPATIFFLVAFHMIALTKTVILADYHLDGPRSALATAGALIVAKTIMIIDGLPMARLFSRRLIANVLWKTLLFSAIATSFRLLEEVVPAMAKHEGGLVAAGQAFGDVSWAHFGVLQMWLVALLFQYCLATELVRVIGAEDVRAMLLTGGARPRNPVQH